MNDTSLVAAALYALNLLLQLVFIVRVLLRPHRQPTARIAWLVIIMALPVLGILTYILLGEVNIGKQRIKRMREVLVRLPPMVDAEGADTANLHVDVPERYEHLFWVGRSISGFAPIGGNRGRLLPDSNTAIDALVADIDDARHQVHLLFYIWLPDNNGCKVIEALKRATKRGVICRAMVDDLGSRLLIRSEHWSAMRKAGICLARASPIGNPLLRPFKGRIDMRNHRKIVVIDDHITYCGSQNCADPEFRIKAKYAPWVDILVRFEGPIARQNQHLFAGDWMAHVDDDISALLQRPIPAPLPGFPAQVIGAGPTVRYSAMPEIFELMMYTARHELVISTPYYVPDESMQDALCASARRGVTTTLILPARNDSWIVGAASRSYYSELLAAGVGIFEYEGGLLHAKSLVMDGEVALIGSANMDRRSFELNDENNILFYDPALTAELRQRQDHYIASSRLITTHQVASWTLRRRLWNNAIAMLGPVL